MKPLRLDDVKSLPKELWQLPSLEKLVIHSDITPLPAEVEELREIKSIELELRLLWSDVPNQSELQKIDMLKNLDEYSSDGQLIWRSGMDLRFRFVSLRGAL
jgi:hypothetical protein